MSNSNLSKVLEGTTPEEKQKILGDLVAQGGVSVDDQMLVVPGLANHFQKVINAQAKTMELLPLVVDQRVTEKLDGFALKLDDAIKRVEAKNQFRAVTNGFNYSSIGIGIIVGSVAIITLSWFFLIPREVARQRGADWAIGEYLTSPEGRAFRKSFKDCYQKRNCDSKH
jgi:hypothetical protein